MSGGMHVAGGIRTGNRPLGGGPAGRGAAAQSGSCSMEDDSMYAAHEQQPEQPRPLPVEIADRLRSMIIHDEIAPGTRLQERTFAARLDVSRTPLRDATKILAREGLVVLTPNHGAQVVEFSPGEIKEMLLVYSELDGLAGRLACEHATDADIDEVAALVEEIDRAVARGDRRAYFTANQAFHLAIVTAARNATLADAHRILNLRLYRTRYLAIMDLENWTEQAAEHPKLLNVLRARDGDAMEAMVKQHMLRAWEFIEKSGVVAPPAEPERAAAGPAGRARVEG